ncbi:MAG: hypothetical protein KGH65_03590 [Candidatus Micrarchaeota archaeon]|nr:hypothetical protein [Candidatus Micrarchaeota archaeon]
MGFQTANGTYQNTVTTSATAGTVTQPAIPLNLVADNASACTFRLDFPSASGTTFNFDGFQNEPSVTGTINPSPFLLTNIIAGSIIADFISVNELSALSANMGTVTVNANGYVNSGQTAFNTGTGWWLGNSSGTPITTASGTSITDASGNAIVTGNVYDFSVGDGTNGISWDGKNFVVNGGEITGDLTVSTAGHFNSGMGAWNSGNPGWWLEYNSGTPRAAFGDPSGAGWTFDGSAFKITNKANQTIFDSTNLLYLNGSTIDSLRPATAGADKTASAICAAITNIEQGVAYDGVAITFSIPYSSTPIVIYSPGGLSYSSSLTGSQAQVFTVTNLTTTGFTPSLKLQQIGGAPTNESINFGPSTVTNSTTATLVVPGGDIILNGLITCNFSVTLTPTGGSDSNDTVIISIDGTQLWSRNLSWPTTKTWTFSIVVTDTAAVNGSVVTISDSAGAITATTCTYQAGSAATSVTATPANCPGVPYTVYPPS